MRDGLHPGQQGRHVTAIRPDRREAEIGEALVPAVVPEIAGRDRVRRVSPDVVGLGQGLQVGRSLGVPGRSQAGGGERGADQGFHQTRTLSAGAR